MRIEAWRIPSFGRRIPIQPILSRDGEVERSTPTLTGMRKPNQPVNVLVINHGSKLGTWNPRG